MAARGIPQNCQPRTRTHQLSPGEAGPQESKDTWVRGGWQGRRVQRRPPAVYVSPLRLQLPEYGGFCVGFVYTCSRTPLARDRGEPNLIPKKKSKTGLTLRKLLFNVCAKGPRGTAATGRGYPHPLS